MKKLLFGICICVTSWIFTSSNLRYLHENNNSEIQTVFLSEIENKSIDSLVFCYKCDTLNQILLVKRLDKYRIYFEFSSYNKKRKEKNVAKGVAENKYSDIYGSETDINDDGSLYPVIEYLYECKNIYLSLRFDIKYTIVNIKVADEIVPNKYCPLYSVETLSVCK